VQEAYGAAAPSVGTLADDAGHDRVLVSLDRAFSPAAPVGADLNAAFGNLLDQAWESSYPGHPLFEPPDVAVTVRELAAVYAHVERAVADPDGRVRLEGEIAAVRRVANALGVGTAGETHFLFGDDRFGRWGGEFERAAARESLQPRDPVTVERVRRWIEGITPKVGLKDEVADLVVLAWAALRQRSWIHHGVAIAAPRPGALRPEMNLRSDDPPPREDWELACHRAAALFGIVSARYLTAPAVAELAEKIRTYAAGHSEPARALVGALTRAYGRVGLPLDAGQGRLATARAASELLARLAAGQDRVGLICALARAALPARDEVAARSISSATVVTGTLSGYAWDRLAPLRHPVEDPVRGQEAGQILLDLRTALEQDEFETPLPAALRDAENRAFRWLASAATATVTHPPPPIVVLPDRTARSGWARRAEGAPAESVVSELTEFLDAHPHEAVVVAWHLE